MVIALRGKTAHSSIEINWDRIAPPAADISSVGCTAISVHQRYETGSRYRKLLSFTSSPDVVSGGILWFRPGL
ncbi:hypothetical protein HMPREF1591_01333 [Escherichia coli 113303]|nr:hypothetical protein HMPREF1591_01333 [Escherichia coli 113303]